MYTAVATVYLVLLLLPTQTPTGRMATQDKRPALEIGLPQRSHASPGLGDGGDTGELSDLGGRQVIGKR